MGRSQMVCKALVLTLDTDWVLPTHCYCRSALLPSPPLPLSLGLRKGEGDTMLRQKQPGT